jgi:hypothetical membrane protein
MRTGISAASGGEAISRPWRTRRATKAPLVAGIVAVGVYAVGDLLSGLLYEGYSFADQAISELSAYGSPVRPLMLVFFTAHSLLLAAFSVGLWRAGDRNRALRWAGILLLASVVGTVPLHPFFPMSPRGEYGFNDTMHIVLTGVFGFVVFGAVVCGAVAYPGWFRLYSIGSLLVMMVFGWMAAAPMQDVAENLATPWLGVDERISAYVYLIWIVVLAVTVMRRSVSNVSPDKDGTGGDVRTTEPTVVATKPGQPA